MSRKSPTNATPRGTGGKQPVLMLEDETRVLVQRGMAGAMGMSKPSGAQIGRFALSKSINPFISNDMKVVLENPIRFVISGGIAH